MSRSIRDAPITRILRHFGIALRSAGCRLCVSDFVRRVPASLPGPGETASYGAPNGLRHVSVLSDRFLGVAVATGLSERQELTTARACQI